MNAPSKCRPSFATKTFEYQPNLNHRAQNRANDEYKRCRPMGGIFAEEIQNIEGAVAENANDDDPLSLRKSKLLA